MDRCASICRRKRGMRGLGIALQASLRRCLDFVQSHAQRIVNVQKSCLRKGLIFYINGRLTCRLTRSVIEVRMTGRPRKLLA
jgi:hypothetical protein